MFRLKHRLFVVYYENERYSALRFSRSFCHSVTQASLGILQSPLGERVTLPTLGPSGRQLRLNCWAKNRQ